MSILIIRELAYSRIQKDIILLDCSALDWGKISPAIFGSMFQSVMDSVARRNLGAHYTSEKIEINRATIP